MFAYDLKDGARLILFHERHADALYHLTERNRERLRLWLPWVDQTTTPAATRGFIRGTINQFAEGNGFQAGIWQDAQIAGTIGYHYIDEVNGKTELGYWIGAEFEGRGLITRACRALIDYAFTQLNLQRIEIRCAVGNERSRAVALRLGMRHEGTLRQVQWLNDRFVDHEIYGLLVGEWRGTSEVGG